MPDEEIQALLERDVDGSVVKYFDAPDELYDRIIEWRPELKEHEPLMAIFQKNLLDYHRDDDWTGEGDCTGMKIGHEFVFAAFGMAPQVGWNRGLSAAVLLEIYRRKVDKDFRHSGFSHENNKARIITAHGIPTDIITGAKRAMLGPNSEESWTYLINGMDAGDRNFKGARRKERREKIKDQDPVIEPLESARRIQEYLNGLPQQYFGHGSHGNLRREQLVKAAEGAAEFSQERRRDQANRKLIQMRTHPQPLYKYCDRFPRQKADPYNQAMNLPAKLRRPMYTGRDYELDLSKAHFGSYVPVAKREGLEVPILEEFLEADLKGDEALLTRGDLWCDIASHLEVEGPMKPKRSTSKRAYSLVYGKDEGGLPYQLLKEWGRATGEWFDTTERFEAIYEHPLMEELLETRDKLEAIITSRGGLHDANGRFIPLSAWDETKKKENRWRGLMSYVNASFEQELMLPIFGAAQAERERDEQTRYEVWLYQGDGVTVRIDRRYAHEPQIARLQEAVADRANELGVPTKLEVDWPE
jgi:hypothetical protein